MKLKKSFLIYADWEQNCMRLSDEQRGKLFSAVMAYGIRGEDLSDELDDVTAMCFSFMKSQIKRDAEKYEAVAAKNAENGKKGGRPKKSGRGEENKKSEKPGESENWQKEGGRYIPSPANFLLDRRFEDVPESEIEEHEPCYDLDEYLKRRFGDYIRKPE